jgi:hypothetical protein
MIKGENDPLRTGRSEGFREQAARQANDDVGKMDEARMTKDGGMTQLE